MTVTLKFVTRLVILLLMFLCLFTGCKKEKHSKPKESNFEPTIPETRITSHLFVLAVSNPDVHRLFTSDAWDLVKTDAAKLGLHNIALYSQGSFLIFNYGLTNTSSTLFNKQMTALPSFKNFKEMYKRLTGEVFVLANELSLVYDYESNRDLNHNNQALFFLGTDNAVQNDVLHHDFFTEGITAFCSVNGIVDFEIYASHVSSVLVLFEKDIDMVFDMKVEMIFSKDKLENFGLLRQRKVFEGYHKTSNL